MPHIAPFVIYMICSDALYGLLHVILKSKFSHLNTLTLMSVYVPVVLVSVLVLRHLTKTDDPSFNVPQGTMLWLLMAVGFIFVAADYCFIGAYTHGGDVITVTGLALLTPVFALIIGFMASLLIPGMIFVMPNYWQFGSCLLAAGSIGFAVQGSLVR